MIFSRNKLFVAFLFLFSSLYSYDVYQVRKDFPILSQKIKGYPLVYLDSAATTHKPKPVIDSLARFYLLEYATVHRGVYELSKRSTIKYDKAREKIRRFINASSTKEVIFTKGTTDSINMVATSFSKAFIQKGDEIIISEMEHHSNIVPWQMAAQQYGAKLKVIPINAKAELEMDQYEKLLSDRTKLVCIAYMANSTGTINPIETIIEKAHAKNAYVLIDAAQAAAHIPIDVQKLDVDFLVFSGHKLYAPNGIGILYGKKELLTKMPPVQGGGDMISRVTMHESFYADLPLKFEAGTPIIAEAIALGEAVDYICAIGLTDIKKHEDQLLSYATNKMQKIDGVTIIGTSKNKGAIISFLVKGVLPSTVARKLDEKGIAMRTGCHCAQPVMDHFNITGTCRISFGLYNTFDEIDYFIDQLSRVVQKEH